MAAPVIAAADRTSARFAALVAGHTGAPLQIACVYADEDAIAPLAGGQLGEALPPGAGALEPLLRALGANAEPLALVSTSAPKGLAFAAQETGAALLVVGPGSTAQRLLSGAPCAVALVRRAPERLDTIGAAFVDTAEGRAALKGAHALAAAAGARLRVLVAVQPRPWMRRTEAADLRERAEQAAEAAASGLLGAPVDIDVSVHEPAELLLGVAHELDLLVAGARGYGPAPAVLLGGVTQRLAAAARCPLIVCARGVPLDFKRA